MQITILGAGAMGSLFGGLLAESGQAVTLLDINDAHLSTIRREGLRLQSDAGDRYVTDLSVSRPEDAKVSPELLIVFTKSLHTRAALSSLRHLIGRETLVLTLQNGLGNAEILSEFVAPERTLIGVTTWPADLIGNGHVSSHGEGKVDMMSADLVLRPHVEEVAQLLNVAGFHCRIDRSVWAAIWEKVAFNAALNSLCAVTGCSVDQLGNVPEGPSIALEIVSEVAAVAQARGIAFSAERCAAKVSDAIENHRGHKPSMLQDVLAGRRTEIESINGAVVVAARGVGLSVPRTEMMMRLVRVVESRGVPPGSGID